MADRAPEAQAAFKKAIAVGLKWKAAAIVLGPADEKALLESKRFAEHLLALEPAQRAALCGLMSEVERFAKANALA